MYNCQVLRMTVTGTQSERACRYTPGTAVSLRAGCLLPRLCWSVDGGGDLSARRDARGQFKTRRIPTRETCFEPPSFHQSFTMGGHAFAR